MKNTAKQKIYIRTFSVFLAIYMIMMISFTAFQISRENEAEGLVYRTYGVVINQTVDDALKNYINSKHHITNITKAKKGFIMASSYLKTLGGEAAVYTGDYKLIYNTSSDYWICSYSKGVEGDKGITAYAYFRPRDWFNKKQVKELKKYLYYNPKVNKVGELAEYSVQLQGFWVDKDMIIPHKITVTPMYATTFDKSGNVESASSKSLSDDIVYTSDCTNNKGLPYFNYGSITTNSSSYGKSANDSKLRQMVLDKERLKEAAKKASDISCNRVSLFVYRYYMALPYKNTVENIGDNKKNYSEVWTVMARDINVWDKCKDTVIFVWIICFITFFMAAYILAWQYYKTYKKQKELEKQRQETTNALAHDLKTPLSIISGYAQNLIENVHSEKREYYAGNIQANINRMDKIIREMLELSRLETNLLTVKTVKTIKYEEIHIGEVSKQVAKYYKQVCEERTIVVKVDGDGFARIDASLLTRVIDNFFVNALDNMPDGGEIHIRILQGIFEIYNSGSQIPEDMINEIWQPYKKADISRSNTKGTGLGLAISSSILQLYKFPYGAKNVDDGVVFWFKF